MLLSLTGPAYAHLGGDECVVLGGTNVSGECQITSAVVRSQATHGGAFTLNETLRITDTGSITVPPAAGGGALTLNITGGLIIDDVSNAGGAGGIIGDVTSASGTGATITVDVTGNIVLHGTGTTGARITSNQSAGSCSGGKGGNISLTAGGSVITENGSAITSVGTCGKGEIVIVADTSITLGGRVLSKGTTTVGRGGPISVNAGCSLTVGNTATVMSKGQDPGADLVHLQAGCEVLVQGLVASTGPGHWKHPANQCSSPNRPDKPKNASACVEVWSGATLTVDATTGHFGQISADTAQSGGVNCCGWVDLFAQGDITIKGNTTGVFAVHANEFMTNAFGGIITIKSTGGNVSASGLAIQANTTGAGGTGGTVIAEARGDVTLNEARIFAKGDAGLQGGLGVGGDVSVRAFSGDLNWKDLAGGVTPIGDVQPTGTGVPPAKNGTITLESCGLNIDTTGTVFPVTVGAKTSPAVKTGVCPPGNPGAPALPAYVLLPECVCALGLDPDVSVTKIATPPMVTAGSPASYTITVDAEGGGNATNVTLTDTLPSGFTWTIGGADAAACSPTSPVAGGTVLTCSFGTLPAGTTKTITLTTPTSASQCRAFTIANTATVTADGDPNPVNDSSGPVVITVNCPSPTVALAKTTSTPTITAGGNASYSITVTASGDADSTNVVLTDLLPAGLSWTVGGPDARACSPASPVAGGTTLTCNFGAMASGTSKSITLSATTNANSCSLGTISNTATVISSANTSSAGPVIITVNCSGVSVNKTTSTPVISVGGTASYRITVQATGGGNSNNVVLTDTLPAGLSWTVGGADAGACSPASPVAGGSTLTCSFGTVASGSTKSIALSATAPAQLCLANPGASSVTISNTANVNANFGSGVSGPVTIIVNCPDVSVTKTTSTSLITVGDTASYTVTVHAGGGGNSNNVVLTDTLPTGLSWTVGGSDAGACLPPVAGGTTLTCSFGTMASGTSKVITLSAVTTSHLCASGVPSVTISNTASVSAGNDSNASNNIAGPVTITVTCPLLSAADVSVIKTTSTPLIPIGSSASYSVTVKAEVGVSNNVVLTDVLPALVGLSGSTIHLGWTVGGADAAACSPASPVATGATLTCHFGSMAAGTSKTITLSAPTSILFCLSSERVGFTISNTAAVKGDGDTDPNNNSFGPVLINVRCPAVFLH
jgi:uncharacterized repeat protein (TIGR01451 family)